MVPRNSTRALPRLPGTGTGVLMSDRFVTYVVFSDSLKAALRLLYCLRGAFENLCWIRSAPFDCESSAVRLLRVLIARFL